MDPDGVVSSLSSRRETSAHDVANNYLINIRVRYWMAHSWLGHLGSWLQYYRDEKLSYKSAGGKTIDSPNSSASGGGDRGGLMNYAKLFEKSHKQFGEMLPNESSNWTHKDMDLADTRLPHDEDSAERTLPPVSAMIKHENKAVSDTRSDRPSLGGFTSVNQPVVPNDIRTPSNPHVPVYEAQVHNRSYHPVSTPQYQVHTYSYNTPSQSQTTMSNPGPHPTAISGQPGIQYQDSHAQRTAIETRGYGTFNNVDSFGPIMLSDNNEFASVSDWTMGLGLPMYDNGNNAAYYTSASGVNYPYQQPQHGA